MTEDVVRRIAEPTWRSHVAVRGFGAKRVTGRSATQVSDEICRLIEQLNADKVVLAKEVFCSAEHLRQHIDVPVIIYAVGAIRRNLLKDELDARQLSWRKNARDQIRQYKYKKSDIDDWLAQFTALGATWVGEGLLRQVRVVTSEEMSSAFTLTPAEVIGKRYRIAYMGESDPSGSGNEIGSQIVKDLDPKRSLDFSTVLSDFGNQVGDIYLFEDGLWSGVEVRRWLDQVRASMTDSGQVTLRLRHAVATDYGVAIIRHYLKTHAVRYVELETTKYLVYVSVLAPASINMVESEQFSIEEFEDHLKKNIRPIAFQAEFDWNGKAAEAMLVCRQIGIPLVRDYARRNGKTWTQERISSWGLGAGEFAATLVFHNSVPKVCLPLFWLSGNVSLSGRTVSWKPLFYDQRHLS